MVHLNLKPKFLQRELYRKGRELWLAIFLGQRGRWLDYRRVWLQANPVEYCLRVWERCHWLPPVARTHAIRKLERLLHSGRMLPTHRCPISVCGTSQKYLSTARRALMSLQKPLGEKLSPLTARFLLGKTRLTLRQPPTLGSVLSSHKRLSRDLDTNLLATLTAKEDKIYTARADVSLCTFNWNIPLPPSPNELASDFAGQLSMYWAALGLQDLALQTAEHPAWHGIPWSPLSFWQTRRSSLQVTKKLPSSHWTATANAERGCHVAATHIALPAALWQTRITIRC